MAIVMPNPKQQYFDASGNPLAGGKIYTYRAGTSASPTNYKATYSDSGGSVANTNPIILDSRGEATIYWAGSYKVVVKDSNDNTIYTVDNYTASEESGGYVNVKDFGALGDGSTDDSTAILAALAYIVSRNYGGTLFFPVGWYSYTQKIPLNMSGITLLGEGADEGRLSWGQWPTRLIWAGATNSKMMEIDTSLTTLIRGGSIRGLLIDAQTTSGVTPLYANPSSSHWRLDNVCLRNFDTTAYLGTSCYGWMFRDVEIFNSQTVGITLEGLCHHTVFDRVRASGTGITAATSVIKIGVSDRCSGITFIAPDLEAKNTTNQVEIINARGVTVIGGYSEVTSNGINSIFKLGVASSSAVDGFVVSGFYSQGNYPTYSCPYVFDIQNATGVTIGGGNHFRNFTSAVVNSPNACANSFFSRGNHIENVGGTGMASKFSVGSTKSGWEESYNVALMNYGGYKFDGSTNYLDTNALTGIADGKKGTIFWHGRFANAASAQETILSLTGSRFLLYRDASGNINVIAANTTPTTILSQVTTNAPCATAGTYTIMISWDLATASSFLIYVNDQKCPVTSTTFTNDTIDYTSTEWAVGATTVGASFFTGDMYTLWFDATSNLNFDTESVRRKFASEYGVPTFLGVSGKLPTGSAPILFLGYDAYTAWPNNRGSATSSFTENGTPAAVTTSLYGEFGAAYLNGSSGTVTQSTNKSTAVTLNRLSGDITLNNAALASDTTVSFTLTNSYIAATDQLKLNHISGGTAGSYLFNDQCGAGSATINVRNITAGSLSEAIVIRYSVIKIATS